MNEPLNDKERQRIDANLERFKDYCQHTAGSVPSENSDDWNMLGHIWLAWSAASDILNRR